MGRLRAFTLLAGCILAPLSLCGCNPFAMGIATPIPVPAWVTERMEEKFCHQNDTRTPIMPPIKEGSRPFCEDPPGLQEVLRALPQIKRGVPYFYEEFRDNITYTYERVKDVIDPPRFYPLIGPAQLHHCHWRCTVHYQETIDTSYPFPFQCKRQRTEVLYVDKDHLHVFAPTPEMQKSFTQDMTGN